MRDHLLNSPLPREHESTRHIQKQKSCACTLHGSKAGASRVPDSQPDRSGFRYRVGEAVIACRIRDVALEHLYRLLGIVFLERVHQVGVLPP